MIYAKRSLQTQHKGEKAFLKVQLLRFPVIRIKERIIIFHLFYSKKSKINFEGSATIAMMVQIRFQLEVVCKVTQALNGTPVSVASCDPKELFYYSSSPFLCQMRMLKKVAKVPPLKLSSTCCCCWLIQDVTLPLPQAHTRAPIHFFFLQSILLGGTPNSSSNISRGESLQPLTTTPSPCILTIQYMNQRPPFHKQMPYL